MTISSSIHRFRSTIAAGTAGMIMAWLYGETSGLLLSSSRSTFAATTT